MTKGVWDNLFNFSAPLQKTEGSSRHIQAALEEKLEDIEFRLRGWLSLTNLPVEFTLELKPLEATGYFAYVFTFQEFSSTIEVSTSMLEPAFLASQLIARHWAKVLKAVESLGSHPLQIWKNETEDVLF